MDFKHSEYSASFKVPRSVSTEPTALEVYRRLVEAIFLRRMDEFRVQDLADLNRSLLEGSGIGTPKGIVS